MMGMLRIAAGLAGAFWAGGAMAQGSATAQTQGSVVIVDPRRLAKETEISLAPVARPAGKASVTAEAVGARYAVSGVAGDTFNITMPSTLRLVRAGGTEEVLLRLSPSGSVATLPGAYGARSTGAFGIGGALGVTGTATAGTYQGSFPVILSLQ